MLPDGSMAGVMERPGGARIVLSSNGNPANGYDQVYWYNSVDDASEALQLWDYPSEPEPPNHVRNLQTHPVEFD